MARAYAQLCTLVFLVAGIGAWFLGSATHVVGGLAQGNLGNLTLHMTYTHDAINTVLFVLFVYAGFFANRALTRNIVLVCSVLLLALGVFGFIHGDNPTASISVANVNFPSIANVFNTFFGAIGVLASLGSLSDEQMATHENRSFLREG